MHHELSNLDQNHAVTATYLNTEPAKREGEVKSDTPPTSHPPTPTVVSATPMLFLRPPTLKKTSRQSYSIYSPPNRINAQTSHSRESRPTKDRCRKMHPTHPPPFSSHTLRTICPLYLLHHHGFSQSPSTKKTHSRSLSQTPSLHPYVDLFL
ncbi:hypothetical protein QL285_054139 [Trifolium repens]|nr:hypothetical protein QL285_054139 [Trifolium repens]